MGNLFLFSLLVGLASTLLLIPFSRGEKDGKKMKSALLIGSIILFATGTFAFYYLFNLDRNQIGRASWRERVYI